MIEATLYIIYVTSLRNFRDLITSFADNTVLYCVVNTWDDIPEDIVQDLNNTEDVKYYLT